MKIEFDDYEKDLLIETIQHRLYTDKIFKCPDDELLLKELLAKPIPVLTDEETEEMKDILKFSSVKFFEYFQIVKSYWSMFYETISISIKKNKNQLAIKF